eukprot:1157624-Pelagomonas_calceolata.AAC.9
MGISSRTTKGNVTNIVAKAMPAVEISNAIFNISFRYNKGLVGSPRAATMYAGKPPCTWLQLYSALAGQI